MTKLTNAALSALFILAVAAGYSVADNAGDYVAPTQAESDADTAKQVARICDMSGWPDSAQRAYEVACRREFIGRTR